MALEEGSYEKPIRRAAAPESYPAKRAARGRWIRRLRPPVAPCDPWTPQAVFCETEPDPDDRRPRRTLTVLLTGRRCPWTCVMCDLWRRAAPGPIPSGAVPRQLAAALRTGAPNGLPAQALKLYNAGSFFDAAAVPPRDWPAVAALAVGFERVIVESHPKLASKHSTRARRSRISAGPALSCAGWGRKPAPSCCSTRRSSRPKSICPGRCARRRSPSTAGRRLRRSFPFALEMARSKPFRSADCSTPPRSAFWRKPSRRAFGWAEASSWPTHGTWTGWNAAAAACLSGRKTSNG